jgi:hypothetical protein
MFTYRARSQRYAIAAALALTLLALMLLALMLLAGCSDMFQRRHPGAVGERPAKGTAAWVVDQYYAESSFPHEERYTTGDFARRLADVKTLGQQLPPDATIEMRPITENGRNAVFGTTITRHGRATEWYTFLVRDEGQWKIAAIRTLQFPGNYDVLVEPDRQNEPTDDTGDDSLALASDRALKGYLSSHISAFDSLATIFWHRAQMTVVDVHDPVRPEIRDGKVVTPNHNAQIHDLLTSLGAAAVFRDDRYPHCIFIRLGNGQATAQTGFFEAREGCAIPSMSPDNFIYIERAAGNWYLYRALYLSSPDSTGTTPSR